MKIQSILVLEFLILGFLLGSEAIDKAIPLCNAVLDTNGNEVQSGRPYYIVSAVRGGDGGGLSIARRESSSSCSRIPTVKQHSHDMNFGSPVIFSPAPPPSRKPAGVRALGEVPSTLAPPQELSIHESTDMNIKFMEMPGIWHVNESGQKRYVTLEGKPGRPGKSTVRNWFKIERVDESGRAYRIRYCPALCDSCHVVCGNVGVTRDSGTRWLSVLSHGEFPFVFVKARHANEADSIAH